MGSDDSIRRMLLLHDGDLADVRALGLRIGAQVEESRGGGEAWDVAVANARHVRELSKLSGGAGLVRIAVIDRDARTVRALLRRSGIDLIVCRPVHPAALRGLLLHSLYRGPERRSRRVAVGAPVRFRAGLRRRNAVLADLSVRGCLLISRDAVRVGTRLTVHLPDMRANGRFFAVSGKVVRAVQAAGDEPGGDGFAVAFEGISKSAALLLKDAVAAHLEGPVRMAEARGQAAEGSAPPADAPAQFAEIGEQPGDGEPPAEESAPLGAGADAPRPSTYRNSSVSREVVRVPESFARKAPVTDAEDAPCDRRRAPRRAFPAGRRVVALGDEAARVLIGRDLSTGGMRVEPTQELRLGQRFRIALHVSPGETPLVVHAEVARNDGLNGFVLRFRDLTAAAERYLAKMIDSLPVLEARNCSAARVVVSEILPQDEV